LSEENLKGTYVVEKHFFDETIKDSDQRLAVLESLIPYCFGEEGVSQYAMHLLCENHSVNYKLRSMINNIMDRSARVDKENQEGEKEELIISQQDMLILQTLSLARHHAALDLQERTFLSMSLH
jgi:hypothetical protein